MLTVEQVHRVGKDFVLAGDAVFTIEVPAEFQKGDVKPWYTYRVQRKEADGQYPEAFFVKLLTGPENTRDFTYLGKLDPYTSETKVTARSQFAQDSFPVRLLNRLLARVWSCDHDAYRKHGFKLHHEGRCGRCGRRLTVPSSVESGIGPECEKHLKTY